MCCFAALQRRFSDGCDVCRDVYVIGSSGGACAGSYLFLDSDIEGTIEYVCKCAARARTSLPNALRISEYARGAIERFAPPDAGAVLLASGVPL